MGCFDMITDILIILLLAYLILKDVKVKKKDADVVVKEVNKSEDTRDEELKKEFENLMDYSMLDAINSKGR